MDTTARGKVRPMMLIRSFAIMIWGWVRIVRALISIGVPTLFAPLKLFQLSWFGGILKVKSNSELFDVLIRAKSSDLHVVAQTFPTYFPKTHIDLMRKIYLEILAKGKQPVILDAGAYIGITSILLYSNFPKSRVFAIEPSPANYETLESNTRQISGIERVKGALGPVGGVFHLVDPKMGEWGYRTEYVQDIEASSQLKIVCVSDVISDGASQAPFICKLDIEGAERHLTETDWDHILEYKVVVIEPHDWMMPTMHTSFGFMQAHANSKFKRDLIIVGENLWSIAIEDNQNR
jgi:FkbM family methyltransferase